MKSTNMCFYVNYVRYVCTILINIAYAGAETCLKILYRYVFIESCEHVVVQHHYIFTMMQHNILFQKE